MHVPPDKLRPATRVIHANQHVEPVTGAVMPPIFTSSTYAQESPGVHKGFEYSRSHNPTRYALERLIAGLEGSTITEEQDPSCGGFAFSSGLAAMATALELCDAGAHVISMDDVYGGTNRQFSRVRARSQGLKVSYVDLTNPAAFEAAMKPDTAMVWIETPTNPTLKLVDLAAISKIAHRVNPRCLVVCDNTFASPINQRPLDHGCDIVLHSCTKYLNGHSDCVAGALAVKDLELCKRVRFLQNAVGSVLGPFDSYLVLRGIKTLDVRMARHNESGMKVAKWLEQHKGVERVVYPALASHPQHAIYQKQMLGASGMITFFIKGGLDEARRFLETVRVFALAESLGGVESLVDHPAIMTHASVPPDQRAALGISDALIRLSVGIEDVQDLIDDLDRALKAAVGSMAVPASSR
ncbi:MAG: PLP-dependent transferase [Planctomycetes bacterium]|nr:PLP-dependent transferase [Planctomycetota bacterium]